MANNTPLRASCERCRGQKLRCIPSAESDSGAPCQRCVKAKVLDSCVFRSKSRAQRAARGSGVPGTVDLYKDMDIIAPAFPGTGAFALSSAFSLNTGTETPDSRRSSSTQHNSPMPSSDDGISASSTTASSISTRVLTTAVESFFLSNESTLVDNMNAHGQGHVPTTNMPMGYSVGGIAPAEFQGTSPPSIPLVDCGMGLDVGAESSAPLMNLANLLAEMSPYERQLSRLSDVEICNYPVGDALFLAHRFHTILSAHSDLLSGHSATPLSTPTILLVIHCFMTLTRIYSSIFRHCNNQLLQVLDTRSPHSSKGYIPLSTEVDFRSYRWLRVNQFQHICLCSKWDPTKKAVSMLLSLLGCIEESLGLPPDVKITSTFGTKIQRHRRTSLEENDVTRTALFGEDLLAVLRSGGLYSTVGVQAKELSREIEEVEELLNGITKTGK
ncbi:hypothetical protein K469DRAFT_813156 [Zopfia rhizophila CBS 207.26]|uniref:Zn(2)-C6 fungal-type domain-containing protein n=1 Tax=Zopfia rhizophila CBS 207.26 TaxID=1314779 RepID=A0A6A6DAK9_9PEZI|nr:hypothetical protein K469DRAFT_813156 [Zopfia rhizophila CBS 207.26]